MSADYDATLKQDKDFVRFLVGDRSSPFSLTDEEIEAMLTEEANKYLAAARCGEVIQGLGKGAIRKRVGTLELEYSDNETNAYNRHIQRLRERGAELLQGDSRITFTVL